MGYCAGWAFLLKPTTVLAFAPFALSEGRARSWRDVSLGVGGAAAAVLPFCLSLTLWGAWRAAYEQLVLYNVAYSFGRAQLLWGAVTRLKPITIVAAGYAAWCGRSLLTERRRESVAFLGALVSYLAQRKGWDYHQAPAIVLAFFALAPAVGRLGPPRAARPWMARVGSWVVLFALAAGLRPSVYVRWFWEGQAAAPGRLGVRRFQNMAAAAMGVPVPSMLAELRRDVDRLAPRDASLHVTFEEHSIYFALGRRPAHRCFAPTFADARTDQELRTSPPGVIVTLEPMPRRAGPHTRAFDQAFLREGYARYPSGFVYSEGLRSESEAQLVVYVRRASAR